MAKVTLTITDNPESGPTAIHYLFEFDPPTTEAQDFTTAQQIAQNLAQMIYLNNPEEYMESAVKNGIPVKQIVEAERQQNAGKRAN